MAEQKTTGTIEGIDVEIVTDGPEAQEGHEPGSDVLHMQLRQAFEEVAERYE